MNLLYACPLSPNSFSYLYYEVITLGFQNPVYQPMETDPSVAVCVLMLAGQLDKTIPVTVVTTDGTAAGW